MGLTWPSSPETPPSHLPSKRPLSTPPTPLKRTSSRTDFASVAMDPFPHNYMRPPLPPPPPSSMADLSHHQPHPPPPPQGSWYPTQMHYHPSHSPSPPPPQHWGPPLPPPGPPPRSDHTNAPLPYPPHANPPYPPHPYHNQYPPPQFPQMHPPPPYSNSNQDWGNANWAPHAGWEHQAHSNGEDWGAKARAWAAAKNATESQHPLVQSHYPSQHIPTADSHYHESEQINMHSSPYQNYPVPAGHVNEQHIVHQPEPAAVNSVHPYYAPDGNFSTSTAYPQQDAFIGSSIHKQEVPSSYSSIPGGQFSTEQQAKGSGSGGSIVVDQPRFSYGNQSVAAATDPCDQPLQFTTRFNHDHNPTDSVTGLPTLHPWTPPAPPSISFPSVSPTFPSAAQIDPSISMPPLTGHPQMHGRAPVPNFHSAVSSLSSPIGMGSGTSVHPAPAFHGDVYGIAISSERPKKAAVPNWLRDEIIKKKDVIVSSGTDHHKEESESIDDEVADKFAGKIDQADSKSIDSSRSTEEEDEDYEEVARTAAINKEIKRVLTEVLLKVTSDLFDEIAMRVLSEDDNPVEAKNNTNIQNQNLSSPPPSASKVSEKVPIPVKTKEPKSEDVSESSSSGAVGNVLGLVNYASDGDDDDEETGNSVVSKSHKSSENLSSSNKDLVEGMNDTVETFHSPPDSEKLNKDLVHSRSNHSVVSSRGTEHKHASQSDDLVDRNGVGPPQLTNTMEWKSDAITDHGRAIDSFDDSRGSNFSRKETNEQEAPAELAKKATKDDFREKDTRRHDRHENRSSSARDSAKEAEKIDGREHRKGDHIHGRHDERHQRKKNEDHSGPKERSKEQGGVKYGEKTKELDTKRSPRRHAKEITNEVERPNKASEKDDVHRRSERSKDGKVDRSKHKHASDRGRHKRGRSSSVDSRGRNSKDNSGASYSDNSTEEASEKSRRKTHSKRRNSSPSPVRSKRRQVSQSPPSSKASQRKHSPYSSFEATRGKRSRSRSPAHRRR